MPTGVAMRDPREQLFAAAERVLLRDGPNALTSRAVTAEAGCAKGVLHRHFADFDSFLAELVLDRIARLDAQGAALRGSAGTGAVAANVAEALAEVFDALALEIVGLITSRRELLARLRATTPTGVPLLTEAAAMLASYLAAEQELGRLAPDADVDMLAPMLIGTAHMLFAGRPEPADVRRAVATVLT
ncbi:MAG TPA: TetR family transcriptional regulator [Solirubrobacter sp.]|nr:TetR family transcriptional regulator [Solirubrobacter sp.]